MIQRKNVISIEYELNDVEMQIMKSLSHCPLTVYQLHVILKFHGMGNITSMEITRRLNDLCVMGLLRKKKKNRRVYIYSLAE